MRAARLGYWSRVVPLLGEAGHRVIVVDLPADDESAGLPEYVCLTIDVIGSERETSWWVAQSIGGFTAPLVREAIAVRVLVFVNAMIPVPGETPGAWWDNTGASVAREALAAEHGWARGSTSTPISCTTASRRCGEGAVPERAKPRPRSHAV